MIKLTNRLLTIAKQVQKGAIVADIGTDHAYIPVYLIQNSIVQKVIATDINEGPLNIAKKTIAEYGLEKSIETRLGSGLEVILPGEVDTAIIAGMGGLLIRDILMQSLQTARTIQRFILQPMIAQKELRQWLIMNKFKIVHEKLAIEDRRIYEIIVAENGFENIEDEIYFEIGPKLIENRDPLLETFIQKRIQKQKDIIAHLSGQNTNKSINKLNECKIKIQKLKGVLQCLKK